MPAPSTLPVRQLKFNNGEISPSMYADVSHPKWRASLRTCKNWLPIAQGALVNRPGTKYIGRTKADGFVKLAKFVFSDSQTFLLEFGAFYIRFYKNGQYVGAGGLGSGAYRELATGYSVGDIPYLKFAQVGNTITITCAGPGLLGFRPQDLVHTPGAIWPWTIGNTPTSIPIASIPVVPVVTIALYNPANVYKVGNRVTTIAAGTTIEWTAIQDNITGAGQAPPVPPGAINAAGTGIAGNLYWTPSVDDSHPAAKWVIVTTAVVQDSNGITFETGPSAATAYTGALSPDRPLPIALGAFFPVLPAGWTLLYYRQYRGTNSDVNGLRGWVADVAGTTAGATFTDDGREPDFQQQPPVGTDPVAVLGATFPAVVGYLDQRRLFAGSNIMPMGLILSKDGDFYNFDRPTPGADTDAILITIAAEKLEEIHSYTPMKRGVVLTGQSEWTLSGFNGGPISRTSKELKWQSGWGSNWLNPLKIGTGLLFNTAKSNMVRDFYPLNGTYLDNWDGQELSFMARHMFDLFTITNWDFQSVPFPMVWAVRSDGSMLSLTYMHAPPSFGQQLAEGVCAWAWHTTGGNRADSFEDVCTVPESSEDAVYVVVKRVIGGATQRTIERMNKPVCPASPYVVGVSDPRYGVYLDSALQYDGHNTAATTLQLSGGSYLTGDQVTVTASAGVFAAADADPAAVSSVVLGPESDNIRLKITGFTNATHVTAEIPVDLTAAQIAKWVTVATTDWGLAKSLITLAHLVDYALDTFDANSTRGVSVCADGDTAGVLSWAAGVLTLDEPALVICAGLAYNCDVGLLDAHHDSADIRNLNKKLVVVGFEVGGARGIWAGEDFDKLWEWKQQKISDNYGNIPLAVGYFETTVSDTWNKDGRAVMRQIDPLPVTLTSTLREFSLGQA